MGSITKDKKILGYPTSYAQRRMWFLSCLENDNLVNNSTIEAMFDRIDLDILKKSLNLLVRRHDNFWTNFLQTETSEIVQIIRKPEKFKINFFDISQESIYLKKELQREIIHETTNKKFDLARDVLFRSAIVKISKDKYLFILTFHHIISDAWTLAFLWKELSEIYNSLRQDNKIRNSSVKLQHKDYASWEQSEDYLLQLSLQREYWLNRLQNIPERLSLPLDYLRPEAQTYNHNFLKFEFSKNETKKINKICLKFNVTANTFFLAGFFILLSKISKEKDLVIGTYVANRDQMELERVAGAFLNNLALRMQVDNSKKIIDFIWEVNQMSLEAMNNKEYPFEKLVDELKVRRDPSHPPIFNVVFQMFNRDRNFLKKSFGEFVTKIDFYNSNFFQHEIVLRVGTEEDRIGFDINYNVDLFKKNTIKISGEFYHKLIVGMTKKQNVFLKDLVLSDFPKKEKIILKKKKFKKESKIYINKNKLEEVEQNIKKIWQEVLGVNSIKNKDNFFRLGGHSLLLIQVYDRLDRLYPNKLNVADLFIFSKVSDLAIFICQDNFELRKRKEKQTSHKNFSTILDQVKSGEKKLEVAVDNLFDL